jgi:hypothetical protein
MPWSTALKSPVPLPSGKQLKTLTDVRAHVLALPKKQRDSEAWLTVAETLLQAAEHGGAWLDFVRIATMQALTAPRPIPEPNPSKEVHWRRRKLARDR